VKVSEKDVAYVADLANLELSEAERARMVQDLNSILDYIDRLNELDTTDVPPMAQVAERYGSAFRSGGEASGTARVEYAMREDVLHGLRPSLGREAALGNARESDGTCFKVPKVIER
jgi:aspartyl-tRNA(Asn)/glutamyl-tRNA(Gln) amidotransferase subunit C